jgi:phosphate uptake regulator
MFSLFRDAQQLENVETQLVEMLETCSRMFELAVGALMRTSDPAAVADEIFALDKELNRTEREIRRELLVHGSVWGAEIDYGLMLAYMSVAKDVERVGDYCKNLWNLADLGVDFSAGPDRAEIQGHFREVADLIVVTTKVFRDQEESAVHDLIPEIKADEKHYDDRMAQFIRSDEPGTFAAPRAILYRYIKRISAHLSNLLTSLVMPVDRLDFYKKSKAIDAE